MSRRQRFVPQNKDGVLVEISGRTIGARALLVPTRDPRPFKEVIGGPLLELCACVWTSNHYHILAVVHSPQELARFMGHLAGNLSKKIGGVTTIRSGIATLVPAQSVGHQHHSLAFKRVCRTSLDVGNPKSLI